MRYIGWGTWIRTRTDGVRVRSSTVKLFPSISAFCENSMAFSISISRYKPKLEKIISAWCVQSVGKNSGQPISAIAPHFGLTLNNISFQLLSFFQKNEEAWFQLLVKAANTVTLETTIGNEVSIARKCPHGAFKER